MKFILLYSKLANNALGRGVRIKQILEVKSKDRIADVKFEKDYEKLLKEIGTSMEKEVSNLK